MKRHLSLVAFCSLGLAVLPLAFGEAKPAPTAALAATTYVVDTGHSTVLFRVKHMEVSNFYGRFNDISGEFTLNDEDPAASSFNFTVKTESVDTANASRDQHLKGEEFFNVGKHPEMTFKSTAVKKSGATEFEVTGDLTLAGTTKPVTVKFEKIGEGKGRKGEPLIGLETKLTIKRSEFGMGAMVGPLGDDVRLIVSVEAAKKEG